MEPHDEFVIRDIATIRTLFNEQRYPIVQMLVTDEMAVDEIAEHVDVATANLYYHVRLLEEQGLIRRVRSEQFSGAVEKHYYRATAYEYILDPMLLSFYPEEFVFSIERQFQRLCRNIRRAIDNGLIRLESRAPEPFALMLRFSDSRLSQGRAAEFYERLLDLMQEFTMVDDSDADTNYILTVGLHPAEPINWGAEDDGDDSGGQPAA